MAEAMRGGERLAARLDEIRRGLATGRTLRVGFLEGSTYPDGTSVPMVAAIQEYGAPRAAIPPRSFFRPTVAAKSGEWGPALAKRLRANGYDARDALEYVGLGIKGQIQQAIADLREPALSPVTLLLRMMVKDDQSLGVTGRVVGEAAARVAAGEKASGVSTKPLVDSGHLLNSVDYEVTD